MTSTQQNNKMIDEFLTGRICKEFEEGWHMCRLRGSSPKHYNYYDLTAVSDLKYHTSWDWLIPVCKKISEGTYNDFWVESAKNWPAMTLINCDINQTYTAVTNFLKGVKE